MKHLIVSDCHVEFHKDEGEAFAQALPPADILILAGDIDNAHCIAGFVHRIKDKYKHILYVMGNHEAYGTSILKARTTLWGIKQEGFHFLDGTKESIVTIEGQRYLGCSLWFPFATMNKKFEGEMNDFTYIENFKNEVYEQNRCDKDFLIQNVQEGDFVITHYLPSMKSVSPQYMMSPTNRFYVTDMDWLIVAQKPSIWVHGHTHDSQDYRHNDTVVFCNPYGYEGHGLNPNFQSIPLTIKELRRE